MHTLRLIHLGLSLTRRHKRDVHDGLGGARSLRDRVDALVHLLVGGCIGRLDRGLDGVLSAASAAGELELPLLGRRLLRVLR